jgi:hypothetical protein
MTPVCPEDKVEIFHQPVEERGTYVRPLATSYCLVRTRARTTTTVVVVSKLINTLAS